MVPDGKEISFTQAHRSLGGTFHANSPKPSKNTSVLCPECQVAVATWFPPQHDLQGLEL